MISRHSLVRALLAGLAMHMAAAAGAAPDLSGIRLPEGFAIEVFAADVPNARSMVLGDEGTLFVGTRKDGRVWALPTRRDADGSYAAGGEPLAIASGLNSPNGVAFRDGALYVAEISRIIKYPGIESRLTDPPPPRVIRDDYPTATHHGWKYIAFGPDGKLYVPIGAPCNICDEPGFAVITRINPDGSDREVFARGVRNTVGFTWHPLTGEMWFTDNGRDWMGDDLPPCELNHAPEAGMHFGYPYCHGADVKDPEFGAGVDCGDYAAPARELGPHVAPLGVKFYTGTAWPEQWRNQVFIAEHGSWNRSEKIGYRVMLVRLEGDRAVSYEPFAEGWLQDGEVSGRPVDLLVLPDGSMLVSDDKAGAIYRITWQGDTGQ